ASGTFTGKLCVGYNGGTGSIDLSGSATINASAGIFMGYNGSGTATGGYGDLTMSGGQITARNFTVTNDADACTNDITMTGGTMLIDLGMSAGYARRKEGLGSTTFDISGNSIIIISNGSLEIGWGGTGNVIIGSGNAAENAKITSAMVVYLGYGWGTTEARARLDLNAGGTLEAPNIVSGCESGASVPLSSVVNFNGGTLRATAASADFIANTGGSVEFKTNVQAGGAVIDTNSYDIAINTALVEDAASPDGGLTKLGSGTLTLAGVNTYTGDTLVEAGTLSAANNTIFADLADLWIASGATVDLNFTGSDTIAGLYLDDILQAEGTWGATGSGAQHINDVYFSGTGTLLVGAATLIPGDADGNGVVNELDAVNLADNWGAATLNPTYGTWWKMGDFNDDHVVNAADAAILAANWGAHAESSPENGSPVPEPTTLAGLFAAVVLFVFARRRK
ncbi:MAG: autotransporter-associated beta strand repeat-containing protein, partial [Pirellulales bacterium]|nr:autotransporter-associated beta strand repeat-containing protein [Pirellulales bacterium]